MRPGPPLSGGVRRLLRLLLPAPDHRTLLSELDETYRLRTDREGPEAARAWLRREGRRAVLHALRARLRRAAEQGGLRAAGVLRDLHHGARSLARAPVFTLAVALTLALGIGGTAAVFAVVHGVLVQPLPYPEPDELVHVYTQVPDQDWNFSMADVEALAAGQSTFEEVAFMSRGWATLATDEGAERVRVRPVTPGFFTLLGLEPAPGRAFTQADAEDGADPVAVVSRAFWRTRLGGDPSAVGRTIRLDGRPVTVVGVLSGTVDPLTDGFDVLVPLTIRTPPRKGPFSFVALGRVDPDMRGAAARELAAIEDRIFPVWRDSWPRPEATWLMRDLDEMVLGDTGPALWIMLAAVGLLLLIACVNAVNLLVARGMGRRRELGARAALGASRGRLLQHLVVEHLLLGLLGAGTALAVAVAGIHVFVDRGADFLPRTPEIGLTEPVLLFLGGVTLGALLLVALVPALQISRGTPTEGLGSGGRGGGADPAARRLRRVLVAGQFAITAPLLAGAGLLLVSLGKLQGVDPGYEVRRTVTAGLTLPPGSYPDSADQRLAWQRLAQRAARLPGVEAAGVGTGRPPDRYPFANNFVLDDRPLGSGEVQPATPWVVAEPRYFRALGLAVVEGRMFDGERDPPRVLLVDETWARRFYPGEGAVGRRLRHGGCTVPSCPTWSVIGVVEDVRYTGMGDPGAGTVYMNFQRWPAASAFLVLRTRSAGAEALLPGVRRVLREEEPGAPVTELATGTELVAGSLEEPRYLGLLVAAFGALALLLALVGAYGIMAYFVQQHRKDLGIRLALGGAPGSVARMVLGRGMKLAAGGTGAGLLLGLALSRYLESLLFEVRPTEPGVYAGVVALLMTVAAAACLGPARRAARTDPVWMLKDE